MPCNYRNKEKVKNVQNGGFHYSIQVRVIDLQNLNTMYIFVVGGRKTSIIRKNRFYPDYWEYQIRRQGYLVADCDGLLSKVCFGPEILINPTPFLRQEVINRFELISDTLQLISNLSAEVESLNLTRKRSIFSVNRGFPVLADRNRHRIWIL